MLSIKNCKYDFNDNRGKDVWKWRYAQERGFIYNKDVRDYF